MHLARACGRFYGALEFAVVGCFMRVVLSVVFLAMSISMAFANGWPPADEYTYDALCEQSSTKAECLRNVKIFSEAYEKAINGDYDGQRVVAITLANKTVGIAYRPSLACAWSHVILRSGHLLATPDDTQNNRSYCDKLDLQEQTLALAQAVRMMSLLFKPN